MTWHLARQCVAAVRGAAAAAAPALRGAGAPPFRDVPAPIRELRVVQ